MKLNQVIALEKGTKTETYARVTKIHHEVQKQPLLSGISRTYQPRDDEGERLPSESTRVQMKAREAMAEVASITGRLMDLTITKDTGNTIAAADIVVEGQTLATKVPVTTLLFLEKQLTDIATIVSKLPILDPSEEWHYDASTDSFATTPVKTVRSKKVPRNHVKAVATEKHPAQVEVWYEDTAVGDWTTTKFSGALPASEVNAMLARVRVLQNAVKVAREEANSVQVADVKIGQALFGYVLGE